MLKLKLKKVDVDFDSYVFESNTKRDDSKSVYKVSNYISRNIIGNEDDFRTKYE